MNIKFVSNRDGGWLGNGFGTTPNTYAVLVDGVNVGRLCGEPGYIAGWKFHRREITVIGGVTFEHAKHPEITAPTLAVLKAKVKTALTATA